MLLDRTRNEAPQYLCERDLCELCGVSRNHFGGNDEDSDEECGDDEDVEGPDEDGDFWCNYCDEYLDQYGVIIDYDDDEED